MELEQKSISYCRPQLAETSICTETTDCIVPDTFPDVGRVVFACGSVTTSDRSPQSGRLLISGTAQASVLYEPENSSGLRLLEVPVSFAHIEENDLLDSSSACLVECRVGTVEASIVNSRKLSIAVNLVFSAVCCGRESCDYTENIADEHIELLSDSCEVTVPELVQAFPFSVLEDIPAEDTDGLSVLRQSCVLRVSECRAMQDRVVIRGSAELRCLVLQADEAVRIISKVTPFTQVFEMTGVSEDDTPDVQLALRSFECRVASDDTLSCTVNADAMVSVRRNVTLRCIRDFYLPGTSLLTQEDSVILYGSSVPQPFSSESTETVQTAVHASHIVSADAVCCGSRANENGTQLSVAVHVLFLDEEQHLCSLQRVLPLCFSGTSPDACLYPRLSVRTQTAGERGLTLTVTAEGESAAHTPVTLRHIRSAEPGEKQKSDGVSLTLRHIDSETRLWDIAKDNGSTCAAICAANDLPPETAAVADTMLLIPRCC